MPYPEQDPTDDPFDEDLPPRPPRDRARALRVRAEKADPSAAFSLGWCLANGQTGGRDEERGLAWYRRAADKGHALAQYRLGLLHAEGRLLPADDRLAAGLFLKAAEQGLPEAAYMLGVMHASGRGVDRDQAQAVAWCRKAAAQGHAEAQFTLGLMCARGDGLPRDGWQAVSWCRKAAALGHAEAQHTLAVMYASGDGVVQDPAQAVHWYRLAADGTVTLRVHAQPGARRTEVAGIHGESVKIRLAAPALEDRANEALVAFIAERFAVPRRAVTLLAGARSREKRIEVRGSAMDPGRALGL